MTDVLLLWDKPLLFEKLFREHGYEHMRVDGNALGTPFLPATRCLIVPTGFANTAYTKVYRGIENKGSQVVAFVKKGGVLVVFGACVSAYNYNWLPFELTYVEEHMQIPVEVVDKEMGYIISVPLEVYCDGYFSKTDGDVILRDKQGRALMVKKKIGDGLVIATTVHEFPTKEFLKYVVEKGKHARI
ncbi:hypothetical protein [Methanohalophilus sp.]|uniref:hypothetical protein n=1 Tax=Methanohalophilus sp. TaxID=1966352 RepID=UPI00260D7EC6|nr:hypothetical protein [Methanohalophilus sp.]MDK2891930.1 hypothetical protein [Methanohalophilus sp.]